MNVLLHISVPLYGVIGTEVKYLQKQMFSASVQWV